MERKINKSEIIKEKQNDMKSIFSIDIDYDTCLWYDGTEFTGV